jgi:predicted cupin superfamily sugar epimerase
VKEGCDSDGPTASRTTDTGLLVVQDERMRPPLAESLDLEAHPEGGWYRRTWTAPARAQLSGGRDLAAASAILFHLPAGEASAWHRVRADELWIAQVGRVTLEVGGTGPAPADVTTLTIVGVDMAAGDAPQMVVPSGTWQRTRPGEADALVTCVVSPEFHFDDFELHPAPRTEPT